MDKALKGGGEDEQQALAVAHAREKEQLQHEGSKKVQALAEKIQVLEKQVEFFQGLVKNSNWERF